MTALSASTKARALGMLALSLILVEGGCRPFTAVYNCYPFALRYASDPNLSIAGRTATSIGGKFDGPLKFVSSDGTVISAKRIEGKTGAGDIGKFCAAREQGVYMRY